MSRASSRKSLTPIMVESYSNKQYKSPKNEKLYDDVAQSSLTIRKSQTLKTDQLSNSGSLSQATSPLRSGSIIKDQDLKYFHPKTRVKFRGLNIEIACQKEGHEKNKLNFICQATDCQADSRLGCAHCYLHEHMGHTEERIDIQQFFQRFDDNYAEYKSICTSIITIIPRMEEIEMNIKSKLNSIRQEINIKLDTFQENLINQIVDMLTIENTWSELTQSVEQLNKKNIFEMNCDDLKNANDFISGFHVNEIQDIKSQLKEDIDKKQSIIKFSVDRYFIQLQNDIKIALLDDVFQNFQLSVPDEFQDSLERLTVLEKKQMIIQEEQYIHQGIVKRIHDRELQAEMDKKKHFAEIEKQKKELERQQKEKIRQEELARQKKQEEDKLEKIKKTFPYKIFTSNCSHSKKFNMIPIFPCCNQAYQCADCHGCTSHPPLISTPSMRYCMKCLEIYQVIYSTLQPVNCLKCLEKEHQPKQVKGNSVK